MDNRQTDTPQRPPSVVTPSVVTPSVVTPSVVTPSVVTPSVVTPSVATPSVATPSVATPSDYPPDAVPTTIIIIPAFNEGAVVAMVVRQIREQLALPVLVIDDASSDNTAAEAARAGAVVISLCAQLGAWGATQTGLRYAQRLGYETVVAMDADGQHPAAAIGSLLAPITAGEADVVIGCCTQRGSLLRRFAWTLMKRTSGISREDVTSGFRVYNDAAIEALCCWRATLFEYQDIGVLLLLQAAGLRLVDVEVTMQIRQEGGSRVFHSWLIVAYYMCSTLLLAFTKRSFTRRNRRVKQL